MTETEVAAPADAPPAPTPRSPAAALALTHWPFVLLIGAAAAIRLVFWLQLKPGLMFADSWIYLNDTNPLTYLMYRPAGYVFVLLALGSERNLELVTALQHLAGLATGALVYLLCLRQGLSRWLAVIPAGLFLLNAFTVVLEQYLLTEAFFALLLLLGIGLAVVHPTRPLPLALSGLCLALTVLLRGAGMFAVPFWLVWLAVHNRNNLKVLVAPLLALVIPLAGYIGVRNASTDYGTLSIIRGEGWFLYGRAMSFADCSQVELDTELEPLCPAGKPEQIPEWYVWAPESPARTFYADDDPSHNDEVRKVALEIIRQQPLDFAVAVAKDLSRAFRPAGGGHDDASVVLAYEGEPYPFDVAWPAAGNIVEKFNMEYRIPKVSRSSFPALYWRFARLPNLLLGISVLLVLTAALRPSWRRHPRAQVAFLLGSIGVGMLFFSVASHTYTVRYVVPVVPLIAAAGVLALSVLVERRPGKSAA